MIWNLINTGYNIGSYNMEFDEREARRAAISADYPTLRFYGWKPPAISIGYNQSMDDFDTERISAAGINIVRRPTGGRAIFHSDEVTYSVITQLDDRGPRALYKFINEGLLKGLQHLGVDAELTGFGANFPEFYKSPSSIPCFSSSAKCEIQYKGRKLVGSAQRRYGKAILQHGSILLGPEHRKLVDFLAPHLRSMKDRLSEEITARTIDLYQILGKHISYQEAIEALVKGFAERHGISFSGKLQKIIEGERNETD
jgi:lipoate-protein ligase A